jgi:hypothetical protein
VRECVRARGVWRAFCSSDPSESKYCSASLRNCSSVSCSRTAFESCSGVSLPLTSCTAHGAHAPTQSNQSEHASSRRQRGLHLHMCMSAAAHRARMRRGVDRRAVRAQQHGLARTCSASSAFGARARSNSSRRSALTRSSSCSRSSSCVRQGTRRGCAVGRRDMCGRLHAEWVRCL